MNEILDEQFEVPSRYNTYRKDDSSSTPNYNQVTSHRQHQLLPQTQPKSQLRPQPSLRHRRTTSQIFNTNDLWPWNLFIDQIDTILSEAVPYIRYGEIKMEPPTKKSNISLKSILRIPGQSKNSKKKTVRFDLDGEISPNEIGVTFIQRNPKIEDLPSPEITKEIDTDMESIKIKEEEISNQLNFGGLSSNQSTTDCVYTSPSHSHQLSIDNFEQYLQINQSIDQMIKDIKTPPSRSVPVIHKNLLDLS